MVGNKIEQGVNPAAQQPPAGQHAVDAFWTLYSALVAGLLREGAHAEVTLVLRDRGVQLVRVNRTFIPSDLPGVRR